jgi:hypothetical protein
MFFGEPVKDSVDLFAFPTTQDQPKTRIAEACAEINYNFLKKDWQEVDCCFDIPKVTER